MFQPRPPATAPRRARRRWALFVPAVLAGLPAMRGLSPGTPATPMSAAAEDHRVHADAGHGGPAAHADTTCAAGAVTAGPVLPAPAPALAADAAPAWVAHSSAPPADGWAPPPPPSGPRTPRI
ncbi:DUF6153 family protein [Streptomyces sp. NBC_01803]|uniref:DUF6153 family protein n=1 Tax=Streptomyces sp. NBC_01803 TaxID=2975946 RepID=UPI002DD8EE29|nr:DUF6153 family protein [Streptomyces sp. NBC_01803]WSA44960.1 DUF6153 family protein [Streptomyces sp. NBC_01803]